MRWLLFLVTFVAAPAWAEVYKHIDQDGQVVFTDVPGSKSAKPLKINPTTSINLRPRRSSEANSTPVKAKPTPPPDYRVKILSPANDEAIRADNGNISIHASVEPDLAKTHRLVFFMDGKPVASGKAAQLNLVNVDRGTHLVQLKIMQDQSVIAESNTVSFHVLRTSILSNGAPKAKMAPKAKAAPKARMAE